jgi:hypothetical protein
MVLAGSRAATLYGDGEVIEDFFATGGWGRIPQGAGCGTPVVFTSFHHHPT